MSLGILEELLTAANYPGFSHNDTLLVLNLEIVLW